MRLLFAFQKKSLIFALYKLLFRQSGFPLLLVFPDDGQSTVFSAA